MATYVNIHTHRPVGRGVELRSAGVHPWSAGRFSAEELRREVFSASAQAIGEIGLDRVRGAEWDVQLAAFRRQLELASELDLPVILHCVRAFEDIMRELALCEPRAVIFHGFIGSREQAARAFERGYMLSFGERAFSSPKTMEVLRTMPSERLFLETDESETPIEEIYEKAAALRGMAVAELQAAVEQNYKRIFENGQQLDGAHGAALGRG